MKHIKIRSLFCFLIFAVTSALYPQGSRKASIQLVRSIGGEEKNYTFFKITSAAIAPNHTIYVGDSGAHAVSAYDWQGKYLRRTGRYGQGPNDFVSIYSLMATDKMVYAYDADNRRIAQMTTDLVHQRYIKPQPLIRGNLTLNGSHEFICSLVTQPGRKSGEKSGRLAVMDDKGKIKTRFFDFTQWGVERQCEDELDWALAQTTNKLVWANSPSRILIGFQFPLNKMQFYLYDTNGNHIKTFFYRLPSHYQFPSHLRVFPIQPPQSRVYWPIVSSLFAYRGHFLVFWLGRSIYRMEETTVQSGLLVFDEQGELKAETDLTANDRFLAIDSEGFLIGQDPDAEIPKAKIFKIKFEW